MIKQDYKQCRKTFNRAEGINFSVDAGSTVAIVGLLAAVKTTLLACAGLTGSSTGQRCIE